MGFTEKKILVSFESTTDALAMEKYCKENNVQGRSIPLPKDISSGCGICWISPLKLKNTIYKIINDNKLNFEEIYELDV